jgi:general secretion pathway protein G
MAAQPKRFSFQSGFTLIELLVVIGLIGVLMAAGVVSYSRAGIVSRNGKRKADLEQIRSALVLYRMDAADRRYPASVNMTTMSPIQAYITATDVKNPRGAAYQYAYTAGTNTFTLCTTLEQTTPSSYCVASP